MQLKEERQRALLFNDLEIPADCETSCTFLKVTPDVFGTTDSPTGYECSGSCEVCPVIN